MTLRRTQIHEGTPTMAPKNMCKKARVIDTNQIQSKTQQPDKILNHRDLRIWLEIWLGWHKTWEKAKYECTRIAQDVVLCMGKMIDECMCWAFFYFIIPSWKLVMDSRIDCCKEVTCCSGAWLVIHLGGGEEKTVEFLLPMVGRIWFSKCVFSWNQVSIFDLFSHILQLDLWLFAYQWNEL